MLEHLRELVISDQTKVDAMDASKSWNGKQDRSHGKGVVGCGKVGFGLVRLGLAW